MNLSGILSIVLALLFMGFALTAGSDQPERFFDWVSILIVLGGTIVSTLLSYPFSETRNIPHLIGTALKKPRLHTRQDLQELIRVSRLWMNADVRGVEKVLAEITNPFLRTGVQLIIDGTPDEYISDLLRWRISRLRVREGAEAQMFRTMASYAPAFGMLGTLIGLVSLMDYLGAGDVKAIGMQLAIALLTTLYGVILANMIFLPIAVRLERRTDRRLVLMNMILEGISMMSARHSPALMQEMLNSFIKEFDDEMFDEELSRHLPPPPSPTPDTP